MGVCVCLEDIQVAIQMFLEEENDLKVFNHSW